MVFLLGRLYPLTGEDLDQIRSQGELCSQDGTFSSRIPGQHEVCRILPALWPSDPAPHLAEVPAPELRDDIAHPVVAAVPTPLTQPHLSEGEIEIVPNHGETIRAQPEMVQESLGGPP